MNLATFHLLSHRQPLDRWASRLLASIFLAASLMLVACGGGGGGGGRGGSNAGQVAGSSNALPAPATSAPTPSASPAVTLAPTTQRDAVRLAEQAGFGPTQALLVDTIRNQGTAKWLADQMAATGSRGYQNMLQDNDFGNYREVLRKVALSPVMGDYLDNVNNDKSTPNENLACKLLELFSVGTYQLKTGGTLQGGTCQPTCDKANLPNFGSNRRIGFV